MAKDTGKKLADMMYARQPFDVPTPENLRLGREMIEKELREKAARDAKLTTKDRALSALEAAKMLGTAAVAGIGSIPTRIVKGPEAAEKYMQDRIFIPTTEKGLEHVEDIGQFLEQLETKYKLPPILPEAMALQHLTGPATQQAKRVAAKAAEKGAKNLAAPRTLHPEAGAVIIPGKLTELQSEVAKKAGQYGAKRVQRAADEIKNLEKMYQPEALREAFTGDNAKAVVTMNPADFEKYAQALEKRTQSDIGPVMQEMARKGDIDKLTVPTDEYIEHLMRLRGFDQVPYLNLFKDETGLPMLPNIVGHEGRHRSRALAGQGETSGLVQISPRGGLREDLPRRSQEEYIEALREELGLTDNKVIPEPSGRGTGANRERSPIILPDVYAEGGKVHISDNPDTMQLELAGGGFIKQAAKAVGKAAEAAGMKAPVTAGKELTTLQDTHTSLGDRIRMEAELARKQMEGFDYQYDKGQRVFTKDSAGKNKPPYTILQRTRVGNQPMRADHPQLGPGMGKPIIDPETGKTMRTPYEPGYRVRMERGPDDWTEFDVPQSAIIGDVEMARGGAVHMAGGGALSKLAKLARAPAKTKQEISAIAERLAPQVTGEYVRSKPGSAVTVAGKTKKQFEREKALPVDISAIKEERIPEPVDIEKLKGEVMIGIPGDPTVTGKTLSGVGDVRLESPAPQHGGPLYGLYHDDDHFWASGLGAARRVQNLAKEAGEQYDAPVLGKYIMMGPESINYAQHFADANLQAIDLSKMTKKQIEGFNRIIRQGSPASGPRPSFPGIEDKESAYLHMAMDPELRKHFNALMQQNTVTEAFNLPSGNDIRFAITEPALRDLETGVTGFSMGRMRPDIPSSELKLSEHPTYSHDIPGSFLGQTKYPVPYELSFPDTLKTIRENPKQAGHEFGSLKMVGPRQTIDQQLIDELRMYEERMKELTGKAAGGAVNKAAGGEITSDDLILEERKL